MPKFLRFIFSDALIPRLRALYMSAFLSKASSSKAYIHKPLIFTARSIVWGSGVVIRKNARIEGVSQYNSKRYSPKIILHDGVSIQQNCHITCAEKIEIGENTALASNVTVTDIDHPYQNISIPIERQDLIVKPVSIGRDCKIYNNAVILQGSSIGNHCVVGANSVVKGHFPDYSIIVGIPARIVKRYHFENHRWEETLPDGSFKE